MHSDSPRSSRQSRPWRVPRGGRRDALSAEPSKEELRGAYLPDASRLGADERSGAWVAKRSTRSYHHAAEHDRRAGHAGRRRFAEGPRETRRERLGLGPHHDSRGSLGQDRRGVLPACPRSGRVLGRVPGAPTETEYAQRSAQESTLRSAPGSEPASAIPSRACGASGRSRRRSSESRAGGPRPSALGSRVPTGIPTWARWRGWHSRE